MATNNIVFKDVLLGSTADNELVDCDISVYSPMVANEKGWGVDDRKNRLSISFGKYRIVDMGSADCEKYWADNMDMLDNDAKLDMLERFNCRYSELPEYIAEDMDVEGTFDIEYPFDEITVNDTEFAYQMTEGGQFDPSDMITEYVNEDAFKFIVDMWQAHHLEDIHEDTVKRIVAMVESMGTPDDETNWITRYIAANFDDVVDNGQLV